MTLIERINQKATEKGLNIKQLEQLAGLSNGQIGKWKRQKPSYDKVQAVANSLNVSIDWLITGKESGNLAEDERKLIDIYRNCNTTGKQDIHDYAEMIQTKKPISGNNQISTSAVG